MIGATAARLAYVLSASFGNGLSMHLHLRRRLVTQMQLNRHQGRVLSLCKHTGKKLYGREAGEAPPPHITLKSNGPRGGPSTVHPSESSSLREFSSVMQPCTCPNEYASST